MERMARMERVIFLLIPSISPLSAKALIYIGFKPTTRTKDKHAFHACQRGFWRKVSRSWHAQGCSHAFQRVWRPSRKIVVDRASDGRHCLVIRTERRHEQPDDVSQQGSRTAGCTAVRYVLRLNQGRAGCWNGLVGDSPRQVCIHSRLDRPPQPQNGAHL